VAALPPVVNFSATPLSGTVPVPVSFTDASINYPDTWLWTYGDGNYSYLQNPTHIYEIPGTYNVTLTATNTAGSGNLTKVNYITVRHVMVYTINATATPPGGSILPNGSVSVTEGNSQNFTINVNNGYRISNVLVDNVSQGAITYYLFTNVAANHTITAAFAINQYTIYPSISGGNGSVSPSTNQTVDYGATPIFNFTPDTGYHLSDVTVNGTSVSFANNSYTFPAVTADQTIIGTFAIDQFTITPSISGGHGNVSPSTVQTVNYGDTPSFNFTPDTGYHLDNVTVNGTPVITTGNNYTFPAVTTNKSIVGTFQIDPPVANFTATPLIGAVPLTVQFTDTSNNTPTSWYWQFNDFYDGNSTLQDPSYNFSYPAGGHYTITLTATNAGGSNTTTRAGYILAYVPAVANFTANVTTGAYDPTANSLPVQFYDYSTGSPSSWYWDFGDLTNVTDPSSPPQHSYRYGLYSVNLTVWNTYSSNSLLRPNYINVTEPAPQVGKIKMNGSIVSAKGTIPLAVNFTVAANRNTTSYLWNFGDGSNSTSNPVVHTYTTSGNYNVSVTATNAAGSTTVYAMVYPYDPLAFTSITPAIGSPAGGTPITIWGTNLFGASTSGIYNVSFNGAAMTNMTVINDTMIIGSAPAHAAGTVNVVITTPNGTATGTNAFTYAYPPTFTSLTPKAGPVAGGRSVTITGLNLTGASSVTFGGVQNTSPMTVTATSIIVTTPPWTTTPGAVDVEITTPNGSVTATDAYWYAGIPFITGVSPSPGSNITSNAVTISGTNLTNVTSIVFGGTSATSVTNSSDGLSAGATTPLHIAGRYYVNITTVGGVDNESQAYAFYNITVYKTVARTTWVVPANVYSVNYIVVGGGGGGGYNGGAGGGAGGYLNGTLTVVPGTSLNVAVGNYGAGGTATSAVGKSGGNSSFANTTVANGINADGGGGGAGPGANAVAGLLGGSGGGSTRSSAAGSGITGQGYAGGVGSRTSTSVYAGGGGGGKSEVGKNAASSGSTATGGAGGAGSSADSALLVEANVGEDISGTHYLSGGGGGGARATTATPGLGGTGGGGDGVSLGTGGAGTANTGGGGGGGGSLGYGGAGGTGVVILEYY